MDCLGWLVFFIGMLKEGVKGSVCYLVGIIIILCLCDCWFKF